jgi:hypothetical protein
MPGEDVDIYQNYSNHPEPSDYSLNIVINVNSRGKMPSEFTISDIWEFFSFFFATELVLENYDEAFSGSFISASICFNLSSSFDRSTGFNI